MDEESKGTTAFKSLYDKLALIKDSHKTDNKYIYDRAWHLTTLLNTFNSYYCYDIYHNEMREIDPIFFLYTHKNEKGEVSFTIRYRLLAIKIILGEKEKRLDDNFYFYFEGSKPIQKDATNTPVIITSDMYDKNQSIIHKWSFGTFRVRYETDKSIIHDENMNFYLHNNDYINKYDYSILYTPFKSEIPIPPLYSDIESFKGKIYDFNNTNIELYINLKYITYNRIKFDDYTPNYILKKANIDTEKINLTENTKKYLISYLFGSDISYLDENFGEYGDYDPKTIFPYVSNQDEYTKIISELEKYKMIPYMIFDQNIGTIINTNNPKNIQIITNPEGHDDSIFRMTLTSKVSDNNSTILFINKSTPKITLSLEKSIQLLTKKEELYESGKEKLIISKERKEEEEEENIYERERLENMDHLQTNVIEDWEKIIKKLTLDIDRHIITVKNLYK